MFNFSLGVPGLSNPVSIAYGEPAPPPPKPASEPWYMNKLLWLAAGGVVLFVVLKKK